MNAQTMVRIWNDQKQTRFKTTQHGGRSAIVSHIDNFMVEYGPENVERYFAAKVNDWKDTNWDIWKIFTNYAIETWLQKNPARVVKEKTGTPAPEEKTGTPAPEEKTGTPAPEEKTGTPAPEEKTGSILTALSSELVKVMGSELVDNINNKIETALKDYVAKNTIIKVVEYKNEHKPVGGVVHAQFESILKYVSINEPVLLSGPAGSGKNYIAEQVAKALGLDFYFSNAVSQEYKITGYGDANGHFVETQFYKAFTQGGLFLLDEMDASAPDALLVLNAAIANGYFDFPVIGRVKAHENFRVIANANTFGTGASMEYVGRNQLDAATLNRFGVIEVNYDPRIEESVCPDKDILEFCREFRRICNRDGIHHIVSYREMSRLNKLVNVAGMDKATALKTGLIKELDGDTQRQILANMKDSLPYYNEFKSICR